MLGGLRAAGADLAWLRACELAEKHDLAATDSMLHLVTTVDPRPLYFWLNGARIMAYDMPGWRIAAAGGYGTVPVAMQQRIGRDQAQRALRRLDEAMRFPSRQRRAVDRAGQHRTEPPGRSGGCGGKLSSRMGAAQRTLLRRAVARGAAPAVGPEAGRAGVADQTSSATAARGSVGGRSARARAHPGTRDGAGRTDGAGLSPWE